MVFHLKVLLVSVCVSLIPPFTHVHIFLFFAAGGRLFSGQASIPNGPHVIVVPPALIPVWQNEITMWLCGAECFLYTGLPAKQDPFFGETSAWSQSVVPMHQRIILASSTVRFDLSPFFFF